MRHPVRRGAFAVALLISLVILLFPGDHVPRAPGQTDKIVHIVMFAVVAVAGLRALVPAGWLAVGLIGYGGLAELAQSLPGIRRSTDAVDWIADAVGVLLVTVVYAVMRRRG
jgi:VanZ family protein